MPNFLQNIFSRLQASPKRIILREVHSDQVVSVTAGELLALVETARQFFRARQIPSGERCGLIAANSVQWIAADLALMAEGIVVVPLYHRQTPAELVGMLQDCQPSLVLTGDDDTSQALSAAWPQVPSPTTLTQIFSNAAPQPDASSPRDAADNALLTIIYTSGTSGEPKGVCLNVGNLSHMTGCTTDRLSQLMGTTAAADQIFLWAPMNFAASWMLMLSALLR
jgi:long-chain acyl-CoA synthetase